MSWSISWWYTICYQWRKLDLWYRDAWWFEWGLSHTDSGIWTLKHLVVWWLWGWGCGSFRRWTLAGEGSTSLGLGFEGLYPCSSSSSSPYASCVQIECYQPVSCPCCQAVWCYPDIMNSSILEQVACGHGILSEQQKVINTDCTVFFLRNACKSRVIQNKSSK